jgi:hypothetical protein
MATGKYAKQTTDLRAYCSIISVQQPPKSLAIFHLAWKLFISYTQEAETIVGLGRESFSSSRSQVLLMQHSVKLVKKYVSLNMYVGCPHKAECLVAIVITLIEMFWRIPTS